MTTTTIRYGNVVGEPKRHAVARERTGQRLGESPAAVDAGEVAISVMPIWIAESSVVGSSISAIADFAPARPCSAAACSRARLAGDQRHLGQREEAVDRMSRRIRTRARA